MRAMIAAIALIGFAGFVAIKKVSSGDTGVNSNEEPVTGEPELPSVTGSITNDPSTWPTGDNVWDICRAIAFAEGANVAGSAPDKLNNPGDISDGSVTYAYLIPEIHDGSLITHFPDKATGWQWLYQKIMNHVSGNSSVYPATITIAEFAQKYAGDSQNWLNNVANYLNISDPNNMTFADYVNGVQVGGSDVPPDYING